MVKAAETKRLKREALANGPITTWEDRDVGEWKRLAESRKVTLPPRRTALSVGEMKKYLHKLKIGLKEYKDWAGDTLDHFVYNNPTWSLRAWLGLVLEKYCE